MSFAFESSDNGAFSPHLPNADVIGKTFERGDIIGYADSLSAFVFPTNSEAVAAVEATTPVPRPHSQEEKRIISDKLYSQVTDSCLSSSNKRKLHDLLMSFEDTFSADKMDVGLSDIIEHTIEMKDVNDPVYKGQFRLAHDQLQLIKDNVVGWLEAGLIEKSNSRYNSPVFCVPKKGNCLLYTSPSPRDS